MGGGGWWLFFFNDTATTEIYTLSLHDALPIWELLNAGFAGSLFSPVPGFLKQRYQLFLPGGGNWPDEYFVRLRVTQQ